LGETERIAALAPATTPHPTTMRLVFIVKFVRLPWIELAAVKKLQSFAGRIMAAGYSGVGGKPISANGDN
jgi:hypothetical protein